MKFGKTLIYVLLAVIFFQLGIAYQKRKANAGGNNPAKKTDATVGVTVRVAKPERRDMYEAVRTTGTLEAVDKADVFAKTPGEIVDLYVEVGDRVEAGTVLARIDNRQHLLSVSQAEAGLSQAQIALQNLSTNWERTKKLYADQLISKQQYEQMQAQYDAAGSQLKMAQVALKQARLNLSYTSVRAPMAGVVTHRDCEKHQRISGAERLFQVAKLDKLEIKVRVTEEEVPMIRESQRPVRLTVEALKGTKLERDFEGRVSLIGPVVDSSSGTVEIKVEVINTDAMLTPGMFTRVVIETRAHPQTRVILKQALLGEEGAYHIFVVKKGPGGRPIGHRVDVKVGLADDQYVEAPGEEITESDLVVIEGQNLLSEGDHVIFASSEKGEPMPEGFSIPPPTGINPNQP